jgi:type III restriction enzyme
LAPVLVYGKLPKRSIQLPTYIGGYISPDFVYVKPTGRVKNSLTVTAAISG